VRTVSGTKSAHRAGGALVGAFLEHPLPKDLYRLSRFDKVTPPWGPPPHGSGPDQYALAWTTGYDGGPIRAAFRWIGQHGGDAMLLSLPKSLRVRGRVPRLPLVHEFVEIPEIDRIVRHLLRHGAAMHDIQELLFGFQEIWAELDRIRPDAWAAEELVEILVQRNGRARSVDAVPASFAFLWNSSVETYHARQLERSKRLLLLALEQVMTGHFG
jgi:hypothetical protein